MIKAGEQAPDFTLPDSNGEHISLLDYRGLDVVLYFYPRDNTPACTKEAAGFRDFYTYFKDLNSVIIGVSTDSPQSHKSFSEKLGLPFPLLADTDTIAAGQYGVYQKKESRGREFWGIVRTTFLIDPKGIVKKVWEKVDVNKHHRDVLETLERIKANEPKK